MCRAGRRLSRMRQIVAAVRQTAMTGLSPKSMPRLTGVAIGGALLVCPPGPIAYQRARSTVTRAVVSARLDESQGEVVAALKNTGAVPLEAWRLTFAYATRASASSSFSTTSDTFMALAVPVRPPGAGPLEPGETRELRVPVPAIRVLKSAVVDGALFGDLSFEGDPAVREEILGAREAQAVPLAKWIAVLTDAGGKDAEQARQTIRRALADGSGGGADDRTRNAVANLLSSPDPAAASRALGTVFERARELALRHRARSPGPAASVRASI